MTNLVRTGGDAGVFHGDAPGKRLECEGWGLRLAQLGEMDIVVDVDQLLLLLLLLFLLLSVSRALHPSEFFPANTKSLSPIYYSDLKTDRDSKLEYE